MEILASSESFLFNLQSCKLLRTLLWTILCRSVAGNSIADHLEYYGVILHSESWNSCRIVMDPLVNEYVVTDSNGNLRLSRDPAASVIKMNTRSGNRGKSI